MVAAAAAALLVLAFGAALLQAHLRFGREGFRSYRYGRDQIAYEEMDECGSRRRLVLDGDIGGPGATPWAYVPSDTAWRRSVPPWAAERRNEILARIRLRFGENSLRFVDCD
jgi:hypothetical protein